ncbi:DUF6894 family protein [Rhizobium halophytocola]|uniref:DUF6894 domain-containing protein n=1 Tax=Rhizobium halophytocola TaxID=735519 RepID=A0ABS4DW48_9HYPH|nr:hypothetical protein [Rhizobium halophytocola]MBP1849918.1 hypothetical protein [Rhizobium halophytocola]
MALYQFNIVDGKNTVLATDRFDEDSNGAAIDAAMGALRIFLARSYDLPDHSSIELSDEWGAPLARLTFTFNMERYSPALN